MPFASDCGNLFMGVLLMGLPKPVRIGGSDTVNAAAAAVPAAGSANGLGCVLAGSISAASLPKWWSWAVTSGPCILPARIYTAAKVSTARLQSPDTLRGDKCVVGRVWGEAVMFALAKPCCRPITLSAQVIDKGV